MVMKDEFMEDIKALVELLGLTGSALMAVGLVGYSLGFHQVMALSMSIIGLVMLVSFAAAIAVIKSKEKQVTIHDTSEFYSSFDEDV